MTDLYFCQTEQRERYLHALFARYTGRDFEIERSGGGKPYIPGHPLHFSLAHSGALCAIAISQTNIGIDTEILQRKHYKNILERLPAAERAEIESERDFFTHWTVREAYAKYAGTGIWQEFARLEYIGGQLYKDGIKLSEEPKLCFAHGAVTAIYSHDASFEVKTLQDFTL